MFPGLGKIDPKQMAKLMAQMGIKSEEILVDRVVIEKKNGGKIVVENPSVTVIEIGGQKTFQVAGEAREEKEPPGKSDADLVMEQAGCSREEAEKALADAGGDIAKAILELKK